MLIRVGLLLAVVVAAAIAANVALLSLATASHEPVGRLSPVVAVGSVPALRAQPSQRIKGRAEQGEPDD